MNTYFISKSNNKISLPSSISKSEISYLLKKCSAFYKINNLNLNLTFTDDVDMRFLHKKYFSKNKTTDVITLDWSEGTKIEGDIFVNLLQAKRQAKSYNQKIKIEICRLVIHGFLHLIGYDDVSLKKQKLMNTKQEQLVLKFVKK